MDAAAIQALVAKLLLAAQALSGYGAPAAPPELAFVPHSELERRACEGPCAVYGWFPPGRTIFLDSRLDPLSGLRARAVLLHELVHYLQQENDAFPGPVTCRSWLAKEGEAFEVERRWLLAQPERRRAAGAMRAPLKLFCRDESPPTPTRQASPQAARIGH